MNTESSTTNQYIKQLPFLICFLRKKAKNRDQEGELFQTSWQRRAQWPFSRPLEAGRQSASAEAGAGAMKCQSCERRGSQPGASVGS